MSGVASQVRAMLIRAGYSTTPNKVTGQSPVDWIAASCPSVERAQWLIDEDRKRGKLP